MICKSAIADPLGRSYEYQNLTCHKLRRRFMCFDNSEAKKNISISLYLFKVNNGNTRTMCDGVFSF